MFKINLVPEVQERKLKVRRMNTYSTFGAAFIFGSAILTILVLSSITTITKASLSSTEKKISGVNEELEEYRELEETVLSLEKGLAGVKKILDGDNNWILLLNQMEKATPSDVTFKSLKIKSNAIEAELQGKTIESLAKFVDSYKSHQIVVLSGTAEEGKTVNVSLGGVSGTTKVKSTGKWLYAVNFNPSESQKITVEIDGNKAELDYDSTTKKLTSQDTAISAEVKKLFSTVETTRYDRQENKINFDAKITFEGNTLW